MRKILALAAFACLFAAAAPSAHADDNYAQVGKDTYLNLGMKFWVNTWQTNLTGNSGKDWTQLTQGPNLGYIPNLGLKYKDFLFSMSYMGTGDYTFPTETFFTGTPSKLESVDVKGNRQEFDMNVGYYVIPQLALTLGYKGVTEDFKVNTTVSGVTTASENKVFLNGVTAGVVGSAPIGHGLSVYGSGVGGWMAVSYTPSSTYTDSAMYEASELGLVWRPGSNGFSTTFGYKFQLIQTSINSLNSSNYANLPRNEVTRGFMLGANYTF